MKNTEITYGALKYKSKLCALTLLSLMFCSGCLKEINHNLTQIEAKNSYYKGDFGRSFRLTESLAYQGDAKSAYTLGYMHYYGIGAPVSKALGIAWIKRAAIKGYGPALIACQEINQCDSEVRAPVTKNCDTQQNEEMPAFSLKNNEKFESQRELALLGDVSAKYALGYMYYYGIGTKQNKELGTALIRQAADNGHASANIAMARLAKSIAPLEPISVFNLLSSLGSPPVQPMTQPVTVASNVI